MDYEKELATGTFHIRLFQYLRMYSAQDEFEAFTDETVFHYDMDNGRYTISFLDLKTKADEETLKFLERNNVKLN